MRDRLRALAPQIGKFAVIGVASTLFYLVVFAAMRPSAGNQWANILALLISTVFNTALNRRFTFEVKGSGGATRVQLQSLILLAITVAVTAGGLEILRQLDPRANGLISTGTVGAGNVIATVVRFFLLRRWLAPTRDDIVAAETAPTSW